jgi:exosortase family protein XrtF
MSPIKEFKPALLFLAKFLVFYLAGNILYGIYIESYNEAPDRITRIVTSDSSGILNALGYHTGQEDAPGTPKIALKEAGDIVLYIYEGCNGINVMIVFIAFLFAFGGPAKGLAVFLPLGVLVIHFFNLMRISLLFYLALSNSLQFYYYHKYFFTATLYLVVFALWALWVIRFNESRNIKVTT